MKRFFGSQADDYTWTLQKGAAFVRNLTGGFTDDTGSREENISRLRNELKATDAIVIGAGAGLSTAAGFTYSGERFQKYFFDFQERFGIRDMYSGGFYPFLMRRHAGHGGQGIFISIVMLMHLGRCIRICWRW